MIELELDVTEMIKARVSLINSIEITVGVLDKSLAHYEAEPKVKGYRDIGGEKVRKKSSKKSPDTTAQILAELESFGLFSGVLSDPENKDLLDMVEILQSIYAKGEIGSKEERRLINACQAMIRNRIIDKRLGDNADTTVKEKGFDRPLMDTGQLFEAIKARLEVVK